MLKKANLTKEDISLNLSFDITISLENGKQYKGTVTLELPVGNIIDEGTGKLENFNIYLKKEKIHYIIQMVWNLIFVWKVSPIKTYESCQVRKEAAISSKSLCGNAFHREIEVHTIF